MIGLSPLSTGHPKTFQRQRVRSSTPCYRAFNLPMDRSLSFASAPTDRAPCSDSLSLRLRPKGLNLAGEVQLVGSLCKRHAVTHRCAPTACRRTVSGTISPRCPRYFSPFPYGTGPLSVSEEYLALPDGAGGFAQDSSGPALLRIPLVHASLRLRGCHPLRPPFPGPSAWWRFLNAVLQPRGCTQPRFGLFPFRSPLLRESFDYFLFLSLLRCFSSGGWPPRGWHAFSMPGCPIRTPRDIAPVCGSPGIFAAYRVLPRLSDPRHPPYALVSL